MPAMIFPSASQAGKGPSSPFDVLISTSTGGGGKGDFPPGAFGSKLQDHFAPAAQILSGSTILALAASQDGQGIEDPAFRAGSSPAADWAGLKIARQH